MNWGKLLLGLLVIGVLTFVGAYYVPLYRAHRSLAEEHRRLGDKAQTLERQSAEARRELLARTSQLDALQAEKLQAQKQQSESGGSAGSGRVVGAKAELSAKFDKQIKKGTVSVGSEGDKLFVRVTDAALFAPRKVELSTAGRALACDVARAGGAPSAITVWASDAGDKPAGPLAKSYPTVWALRAARAAGVVQALVDKCGVEPERVTASAAAAPPGKGAYGAAEPRVAASGIEFEIRTAPSRTPQ